MHDDHEAMMARAELYKAAKYAMKLFKMIREGDELEGWVSAKITKAADYLDSVAHYMEYHQEVKHEFEALDYKGSLREALDRTLVEAKKKVEMKKKLEKKKAEIDESLNENDDAIKAHEKQGRRVKRHSDGSYTWYDDKEKIARKVKKGGKGGESVKYTPKGKKEDDPDLDESAKPDFLDVDKDGNKKEPMKKALKDKKIKENTGIQQAPAITDSSDPFTVNGQTMRKDVRDAIMKMPDEDGQRAYSAWRTLVSGGSSQNKMQAGQLLNQLIKKYSANQQSVGEAKYKKVKESSKLEIDKDDKNLEVEKDNEKTSIKSKTGRVTASLDKDKIKVKSGK